MPKLVTGGASRVSWYRPPFGPDGAKVVGPGGAHRVEIAPGAKEGENRYFDAEGRRSSPAVRSCWFRSSTFLKSWEFRSRCARRDRGRDILWGFGSWSFTDALAAELSRGSPTPSPCPRLFGRDFGQSATAGARSGDR